MPAFLYYFPGRNLVMGEAVRSLPCAYAFETDCVHATPVTEKGPDGGSGCVIADSNRIDAAKVRVDLRKQEWVDCSGYWLGWYRDNPPTEETLRRAERLDGERLILGDEQQWLVPVARRWSANDDPAGFPQWSSALPSRVTLKQGRFVLGDPLPRYADLWRIAEAVFAARCGIADEAQQQLLSGDNRWHLACRVLAANYVVSTAEVVALGLLTTETPERAFDAMLEWKRFDELLVQKKRTRIDGPSSSNGRADNSRDTVPPASTSGP